MSDDKTMTIDDIDLSYAKEIRKKLIKATFVDDKAPIDKVEAKILLDSLNAIERVAIANKRIKTDNDKSQSMAALAVELAKIIKEEVDPNNVAKGNGTIPDFPEETIKDFEIPDFETSDYKEMDYEEFKKKNDL